MTQIALPLAWPADATHTDFIVTPSNADAVKRVLAIGTWSLSAMILCGPRKSGRSLFASIFVSRHNAQLIDDAETQDETLLFHAWNEAQSLRRPLLIIADAPPPIWQIQLPDLRSRLSATPSVAFADPDEALLGQLFTHLCERRGMTISPDLTSWLLPRIERSHRAILDAVDRLDTASLSQRRSINIRLARQILSEIDVNPTEF